MTLRLQFPFLLNHEKMLLMMVPPVKEEFGAYKAHILGERSENGDYPETIRKISMEIDVVIKNRGTGFSEEATEACSEQG